MRIKKVTSQHRNDYTADMECEHCGHVQVDRYGYSDANYFDNVIPRQHCGSCGKNRAGELRKPAEEA